MPRFGSGRLGDALKLLLAPVLLLLLLLAPGTVPAATLYVWTNSPSPAAPYASWATAARTIQAAVDEAQTNDTVLVTNGVYNTGGRAVYGLMTNRVAIDKAIRVQSINGPETTWIVGRGAGGSTINGDGAIRCVYVGTNAVLSGFTLTNGHTRAYGDYAEEQGGGGVRCERSGVVTNCIITGNSASSGGGSYNGTLNNCTLTGNSASSSGGGSYHGTLNNCIVTGNAAYSGGGSSYGTLNNCTLTGNSASIGGGSYDGTLTKCTLTGNSASSGGGSCNGTLNNCIVTGNLAYYYGGGSAAGTLNNCTLTGNGAPSGGGSYSGTLNNCIVTGNLASSGGGSYSGTLNNCTLTGNTASSSGGGSYYGTLNNCIVTGNSASSGGGSYSGTLNNCTLTGNAASSDGGGSYYGALTNCIVYFNTAPSGPNYLQSTFSYSCTAPLPAGVGNIIVNPLLATATHLSAWSPCIGKGSASFASGVDIDGEPWENPPCMGADQYVPGAVTGALVLVPTASYTNVAVGFAVAFVAHSQGSISDSVWDFGDGTVVSNQAYIRHAWSAPGDYIVRLTGYNQSNPSGASAALLVRVVNQEVYYVHAGNAAPAYPYTSWATAARTIQEAVDAGTQLGRLVLVTNGTYHTGGRAVYGTMTNRVALMEWVTVRSVNGPAATWIEGRGAGGSTTNGDGAIRCVYVGANAILSGFTLTNGHTRASGDYANERSGGGVWCELSGVVTNCIMTGNSATSYGGGSYFGTLNNCVVTGNAATSGGGSYSNTLNNCVVTGNAASYGGGSSYGTLNNCVVTGNAASSDGGGSYRGTLFNCVVYQNTAPRGPNYLESTLSYSCTTPLPAGEGNIDDNPLLATATHLSAWSPCIGRGNASYVSGVDIDGEPWGSPPCMGADQYVPGVVTGALVMVPTAFYTNVAVGFAVDFVANNQGSISHSAWDFGDGTVVSNQAYIRHAWNVPGEYAVRLTGYNQSNPSGASATVLVRVVSQEVYYVNASNAAPAHPFTSWATAARTIQEAVDVGTQVGRLVLVTNGTYNVGGRAVYGTMTNRVAIPKDITVRSVNGPAATWIEGRVAGGSTINGDGAIRCVYVGTNAVLSGFTLTNGHTRASGDYAKERSGGGVWCELSGVVTNCIITGNSATNYGGGSYSGTLNNCIVTGNAASSGGGSYSGTLNNCIVTGNAASSGGGSYSGTLNNCIVTGNAASSGGGSSFGTLKNCTLTGNAASSGGGSYDGTLTNCIVYFNMAPSGPNYLQSTFGYSCTTPLPAGEGNIDANPILATAIHLSSLSPCIGKGGASFAGGVDIDGEPWGNPPCMGADQYVSGSATGALLVDMTASYTNVTVGFAVDFAAQIQGRASFHVWDFGDGTVVSNQPYMRHAWKAPGDYTVRLTGYNQSNPGGISGTVLVRVPSQEAYYVNAGSEAPAYPYASWATAAQTIQEAVDAGTELGRLILVTNGIYHVGGRAVYGTMTNRVVLMDWVTVRSVNGPETTWIVGQGAGGGANNGDGAIRCAYVGTNAILSGFTLTNGHTRTSGDYTNEQSGGGVWSVHSGVVTNCLLTRNAGHYSGGGSYNAILDNCTLSGNSASLGGGSYNGKLYNCTLTGNSASNAGGGSYSGTLNNCTLTANSASNYGGGSYSGTLNNCIVYFNTAPNGSNHNNSYMYSSCTTPLPSAGTSNIVDNPLLATATHLSAWSPCIGRGNAIYASGVDIDGEPWENPPCMGADQYVSGAVTGPFIVAIKTSDTNVVVSSAIDFVAQIQGRISHSIWDFGDGTVVSNQPNIRHVWSAPGNYTVCLTGYNQSNPSGISAVLLVRVAEQEVYYVNASSVAPAYPYASWATAARTIQEAVDAALTNDTVLVTNGVYNTGGWAVYSTMTNRVAINKAITVRSVNGPATTLIVGRGAGGGTNNGDGAIRCVYVGTNAILSGFTLTNGHTRTYSYDAKLDSGGGVWCEPSGIVTNCTLTGNVADEYGGGSYGGILNKCTLTGNRSYLGGGSYYGTLNNCILTGNTATHAGGGSYSGTLNNCILTSNSSGDGGGSCYSTLNNCTLIGNTAFSGGGISGGTARNCIVYYNNATRGSNYYNAPGIFDSCTMPLQSGSRNITNAPMFVNPLAGDFRLLAGSPCIDAGNDSVVQPGWLDLDGKARIFGAHVDMGAYEFNDTNPPAFAGLVWTTNQVPKGGTLSVSVPLAPNYNPPSFQWHRNGSILLPGQTSSNLVLNAVSLNDAGVYSVVVTNRNGSVTGTVLTLFVTHRMTNAAWAVNRAHFQVGVDAESGRAFWLEMCTNLTLGSWQYVTGVTNVTGWTPLLDTNATDAQRLYRLGSAPWP